jgi:hypothetical protein
MINLNKKRNKKVGTKNKKECKIRYHEYVRMEERMSSKRKANPNPSDMQREHPA